MLKRYALFGYDRYYPCGGWNDFLGSHATPDNAKTWACLDGSAEYYQIVDLMTGEAESFSRGKDD